MTAKTGRRILTSANFIGSVPFFLSVLLKTDCARYITPAVGRRLVRYSVHELTSCEGYGNADGTRKWTPSQKTKVSIFPADKACDSRIYTVWKGAVWNIDPALVLCRQPRDTPSCS